MTMNGLLGNNADGKLVIDISTDGNPTVCNGGTHNDSSHNNCANGENPTTEAITAANVARGNGITINALGVGNGINASFLNALVGINPAAPPYRLFPDSQQLY
jgi:hypothetical protein